MTDNHKTINIELQSIYDIYPLYKAVYGRPQFYKSYDNWKLLQAMDTYSGVSGKDFGANLKGLNILETFAGQSEHKDDFLRECPFPINSYRTMDIHGDGRDVWKGDACLDTYPDNADIIVAHYHSLPCILPKDGYTSRQLIVEMFKRVHEALTKSGGIFFLHVGDPDASEGINDFAANNMLQHYIPQFSPLRSAFKEHQFGLQENLLLEFYEDSYYDLVRCTQISTIRADLIGDDVTLNITIKDKWEQRMWAYWEIMDCAVEAGFVAEGIHPFHVPDLKLNRYDEAIYLCDKIVSKNKQTKLNVPTDILFSVERGA
ncbi:hypothetical protein GR7B_00015 [Vibrio phage vB_VcorM_GR7B]|nr:hypothetical protein GR7B_00015 [Vibrio phage vB_VcorM_GR7B]